MSHLTDSIVYCLCRQAIFLKFQFLVVAMKVYFHPSVSRSCPNSEVTNWGALQTWWIYKQWVRGYIYNASVADTTLLFPKPENLVYANGVCVWSWLRKHAFSLNLEVELMKLKQLEKGFELTFKITANCSFQHYKQIIMISEIPVWA